jgi:hypothetical protein
VLTYDHVLVWCVMCFPCACVYACVSLRLCVWFACSEAEAARGRRQFAQVVDSTRLLPGDHADVVLVNRVGRAVVGEFRMLDRAAN